MGPKGVNSDIALSAILRGQGAGDYASIRGALVWSQNRFEGVGYDDAMARSCRKILDHARIGGI